jgi:hypothetical protein
MEILMTQLSRRGRLALVASLALTILIAGIAHSATHASPAPRVRLTLVALGDSIPFGEDCGGCTGYVTLYARRVERALGANVTVHNRAEHNNLNAAALACLRHASRGDRTSLVATSVATSRSSIPSITSRSPLVLDDMDA